MFEEPPPSFKMTSARLVTKGHVRGIICRFEPSLQQSFLGGRDRSQRTLSDKKIPRICNILAQAGRTIAYSCLVHLATSTLQANASGTYDSRFCGVDAGCRRACHLANSEHAATDSSAAQISTAQARTEGSGTEKGTEFAADKAVPGSYHCPASGAQFQGHWRQALA